jgi:hypothetical protein
MTAAGSCSARNGARTKAPSGSKPSQSCSPGHVWLGSDDLGFEPPLNDLEIADGRRAPKIEFVLSAADKAGVSPLAAAGVRLAVFDWDPLAELLSPGRRRGSLAEALLQ